MNETELIRQAMSILGKRTSERKKQSSRANARLPRKHRPLKAEAHRLARLALKEGRIKRSPCVKCGSLSNLKMHHEDYSKPLDIIWLCASCHLNRHYETNPNFRRSNRSLASEMPTVPIPSK